MNVQLWVGLDVRVAVAYRRVHRTSTTHFYFNIFFTISKNKRALYTLNPVPVT